MSPKQAARWHANIHVVKMIVETAQLLCNVHRRQRELCFPPFTKGRIPYKESAAGHRKLGSMIWVGESLGNYRWGVELGLALCEEYNNGRGRAAGKTTKHKTEKVLEWLRDHEPNFKKKNRTAVRFEHLAMPPRYKKAATSVEAYRLYYYSKRKTMEMTWPAGLTPLWWLARKNPKKYNELMAAKKLKEQNKKKKLRAEEKKKLQAMLVTQRAHVVTLQKRTSEVLPSESSPQRRMRRKIDPTSPEASGASAGAAVAVSALTVGSLGAPEALGAPADTTDAVSGLTQPGQF